MNLMRSFPRTDLAGVLAAVGNRPVSSFENVERDPMPIYSAPKIVQRPVGANAESGPSTAERSILDGMILPDHAADLDRASYATEEGFSLRRMVQSSPRWKTLRDRRVRVFRWEDGR